MGTRELESLMLRQVLDRVKNSGAGARCVTLRRSVESILDQRVGNKLVLVFVHEDTRLVLGVIANTCDSLGWIELRMEHTDVPDDVDMDTFSRIMLFITEVMEFIIDVNQQDIGCIAIDGRPMPSLRVVVE